MKTIILVIEKAIGTQPFDVIDRFGAAYWTDPERKAITLGAEWLAISHDDESSDYEPSVFDEIRNKISMPSIYIIESNSEAIIARFIEKAAEAFNGIIDNDHGWVGSLDEYVAAIKAGLPWLYAKEPPS